MTTDELPLEKRIATELDVDLSNPPVVPEAVLNAPDLVPSRDLPPQTQLLLGGFDPGEVTSDFLVEIHDLADDHDLALDSISVSQA